MLDLFKVGALLFSRDPLRTWQRVDEMKAQKQNQGAIDGLFGPMQSNGITWNGPRPVEGASPQMAELLKNPIIGQLLQAPQFREKMAGAVMSDLTPKAPQLQEVAPGASLVPIDPRTGLPQTKGVFTAPKNDEMTEWQRAQLEKQDRQFGLQQDRLDQQDRRAEANEQIRRDAEARRNRPQATGYVSARSGNPLRFAPDGGNYMDGDNVVDSSELVSAADFNKEAAKAREVVAAVARAEKVKKTAEENKSAFDTAKVNKARALSKIPLIGEQQAAAMFTPEEQTVRAEVARESAAIVNELYGAALSAGEQGRAQGFTPGENDNLEMLMPKLEAAIAWASQQEKALLPGAVSKARAQLGFKGAQSEAPKEPPQGVSPDEWAAMTPEDRALFK